MLESVRSMLLKCHWLIIATVEFITLGLVPFAAPLRGQRQGAHPLRSLCEENLLG